MPFSDAEADAFLRACPTLDGRPLIKETVARAIARALHCPVSDGDADQCRLRDSAVCQCRISAATAVATIADFDTALAVATPKNGARLVRIGFYTVERKLAPTT